MITYMNQHDDEDCRVLFDDIEVKLNGHVYVCEGEAVYQTRLRYDEEDGKGWTFEDLEIDVLISYRMNWDAEWIESPEMDDDEDLRRAVLEYLEN